MASYRFPIYIVFVMLYHFWFIKFAWHRQVLGPITWFFRLWTCVWGSFFAVFFYFIGTILGYRRLFAHFLSQIFWGGEAFTVREECYISIDRTFTDAVISMTFIFFFYGFYLRRGGVEVLLFFHLYIYSLYSTWPLGGAIACTIICNTTGIAEYVSIKAPLLHPASGDHPPSPISV